MTASWMPQLCGMNPCKPGTGGALRHSVQAVLDALCCSPYLLSQLHYLGFSQIPVPASPDPPPRCWGIGNLASGWQGPAGGLCRVRADGPAAPTSAAWVQNGVKLPLA